jgi:hypothetical protein
MSCNEGSKKQTSEQKSREPHMWTTQHLGRPFKNQGWMWGTQVKKNASRLSGGTRHQQQEGGEGGISLRRGALGMPFYSK